MKTSLEQLRVVLLLLGFAVLVTACLPFVGNGDEDETPTPGEIPTVIRPTQITSDPPAASPVPTLRPLPTRAPEATSPPPACTPRNDWPIYTIQSGDTLYSIAIRSETTVDTLVAANCLGNANVIIRVDQELRVPKQPEPLATPSPDAATPVATQQPFFQGTPAPGATGDVTFTFVVAQSEGGQASATRISEGLYQAATSEGQVHLSIVASNAASYRILRIGDDRQLGTGIAQQGLPNAGGTTVFRKIDRFGPNESLIFIVRAEKRDRTTVDSAAISIRWP